MELKTTGKTAVEEVPYGMYVWECADGEILGDDDGNVMNVFVWEKRHRPAAVQAITAAARHYGYAEGKAVWWSGKRPIDDEELHRQQERLSAGLTPDPLDIAAINDEMKGLRNA